MPPFRIFVYFGIWTMFAILAFVLNFLNLDWQKTHLATGIAVMTLLAIIQTSLIELPLMTLCAIFSFKQEKLAKSPAEDQTLILNYNLLAVCKEDIEECLQKMYEAYMGNLSWNVCAVMVSATKGEDLKQYEIEERDRFRAMIFDDLFREGKAYYKGFTRYVHPVRQKFVWSKIGASDDFLTKYLPRICNRFAKNFMVIHRVHKVLKKCGQYQDLMLLSEGDDRSFTYTDREYYSTYARNYGEPLFHDSPDVRNIKGRHFDYTLVLDSDTGVISGAAIKILEIAVANPERGIIQPSIKLDCTGSDTIFMHIESMRQSLNEPMTDSFTALLGQSSYFGKALLKNSVYIENVIGTRENLIERVPVDVLSHDTFEAALLKPLYAGSVFLLEAPTYNYIAWNIRERRWNKGEILLAMYFWKTAFGKPMRWLQKKFQKEAYVPTKLRTESKMDFVTSYIAHSALRQMFMKPLLLIYIIVHYQTHLRYRYVSIIVVMFLVLVFPKFATCNRENYKFVVVETIASVLQFTPEAMVGCVRIVRAIQANLCANVAWVPQRCVEAEFKMTNPIVSAWKHLWGYALVSFILGIFVIIFYHDGLFILSLLGSVFLLPFYTGVTSLTRQFVPARGEVPIYDIETAMGFRSITNKSSDTDKDNDKKKANIVRRLWLKFNQLIAKTFTNDLIPAVAKRAIN